MDYWFLRFRPQFPFRGVSLALLKTLLAPHFLPLTHRMIYKYYQEGTRLLGPPEISWEQSRIVARIVSRITSGCQPPVVEQEALYGGRHVGWRPPGRQPLERMCQRRRLRFLRQIGLRSLLSLRESRGVGGAMHQESAMARMD